jgi:hypothetical protein
MYTHKTYTHKTYTHETYTHETYTHETYTHETYSHETYTIKMYTHKKYTHPVYTDTKSILCKNVNKYFRIFSLCSILFFVFTTGARYLILWIELWLNLRLEPVYNFWVRLDLGLG